MKFVNLLLLLSIFAFGCAHRYEPIPEVTQVETPKPTDSPVEVSGQTPSPVNYFKLWDGLTTSRETLEKLIPVANCILSNQDFLAEMRAKRFTYTDKTGEEVVRALTTSGTVSKVSTYRNSPFSPFTTLAYTEDGTIYMNTRYRFQALTLVHEHFHTLGFGHRNSKDYESAPYQAGIIGEKYLPGCL